MAKYDNFQSHVDLQARRDETREARKLILEKAKEKYEKEERRKEKTKKQGEGTWMLDAVSQRIQKEEKALEKARKEKKKKKKKKRAKKKEKNSSSSSSDDSSHGEEWVEADSSKKSATGISSQLKGPQLQRDSWMEAPLDLFPTISRQNIRDAAQKKKDDAKKEAEKMLAPGQHARELNPYWKDGGTGLPQEKKQSHVSASLVSSVSGDGGLSWLRKAYQRCKEQAKDEGRSLEDVAAERWGSLSHLKSLIDEAEQKVRMAKEETSLARSTNRNERRDRHYGKDEDDDDRWRGHGERNFGDRRFDEDISRRHERHLKTDSSREEGRNERDQHYHTYNRQEYDSTRSRERDSKFDRRHHEEDREKRKRHREGDERSYSRHLHDEKGRDSRRPLSSRFMRPSENDEGDAAYSHNRYMTSNEAKTDKGKFQKPGDDLDDPSHCSQSPSGRFSRYSKTEEAKNKERESNWTKNSDNAPRWKRAPLIPDSDQKDKERGEHERTRRKSRKKSSSSSSSSGSSSSEEEARQEERGKGEHSNNEEPEQSPASHKILSEEELNDLAAKILRAEIMGEEALAAELKDKLENARKTREAAKSGVSGTDFARRRKNVESKEERAEDDGGDDDENMVVLSRTSKSGMVRPILGASDEQSSSGGRRKKRKNVATHGDHGERKKFFHDDDTFDLKTLVEREKAGTAEDQNSMFARLAGRAGDRDLDVDDMFVSKAAKNQDEAHASNRDKMAAILEHRKISAAMEKCQRCFNKIPKHLIIAIGTKSYLCLPPHRSLTDGHCLIVPMSHSSSATSMDEDVWHEMQHFRKSLVQMFTAQDQDIIFMETVMHLKHFPHTAMECIPLEKEVGDLAPIYFKKAIQDAGPEWSDNKKLHDLSKKDIRHVIPKGFPYFSVDFGLQGGFAHVIEDEATFPNYFGREIVGGMLDAEPSLWRKPHKQSFEDQRQKVLQFEQWWSPFDWTRDLNKDD